MGYLNNIMNIFTRQIRKGIKTYGQQLEENHELNVLDTIEMLEEELADAMMYIEHIKKQIKEQGNET